MLTHLYCSRLDGSCAGSVHGYSNFEETSALYNLDSNLHVQSNSSVSEWFDFNNIDLGLIVTVMKC